MSTHIRPAGSTYGDLADYPARDIKTEPLEPDTEEEYLALKADAERAKECHTLLLLLEHHMRRMSVAGRDEFEGHTGLWLETIKEKALPGVVECRHAMEAGARAFEGRVP